MTTKEYREIPVHLIDRNPAQPRTHFDEEALAELAESIRQHGVIQAIEVEERGNGRYLLHHGERRWRASRLAGRETIPALVAPAQDAEALLVNGLLENLHRRDLNAIEEGQVFQRLIHDHKWTRTRVARETGRAQATVAARLEWLMLEEPIRKLVALEYLPRDGRLAEALRTLPPEVRVPLAEKLAQHRAGLKASLKAVERAAEKIAQGEQQRPAARERDAHPTPMIRHGAPGIPARANGSAPAVGRSIHEAAGAMCRACYLKPKGDIIPAWEIVERAAAEACDSCQKFHGPALPAVCKECPGVAMVRNLIGLVEVEA